jgi:hypothetical protein
VSRRLSSSPGTVFPPSFRALFLAGLAVSLVCAETQAPAKPAHRHPWASGELTASAKSYYRALWGVEILGVKPVSSGTLLRFSYRVVDPMRAKPLHDKKAEPFLYDQATRAKLVVPQMEKVGKLRQSPPPEAGREYWMLFSNKGNLVRPGSRVDVVIGNFRAQGLTVQPL